MLSDIAAHGHRHHPQPADGPWTWLGGTVPQWLTVIAAVIAFIWTVFIYRRSVADKRKEQPRLVHALPIGGVSTFDVGQSIEASPVFSFTGVGPAVLYRTPPVRAEEFEVHQPDEVEYLKAMKPGVLMRLVVANTSNEVISNVNVGVDYLASGALDLGVFLAADYMAPGEKVYAEVRWTTSEYLDYLPRVRPFVEFTDAVGNRWAHRTGVPLGAYTYGRTIRMDLRRLRRAAVNVSLLLRVWFRWKD